MNCFQVLLEVGCLSVSVDESLLLSGSTEHTVPVWKKRE